MKKFWGFIALILTTIGVSAQTTHSPFYEQRASLFDILPVDSTSIVFLGNSITNGCEWHELLGMPNVLNRGISGDVVGGVDDRLASVITGCPSKIFLMIGVNDIGQNLSADSIADATEALVGRIRRESPSTAVYVQSVLPINDTYGRFKGIEGKGETVKAVNTLVKPRIEALGATWINLYDSFADENGMLRRDLTNDGLHLLGSGYALWRSIVMPYVKE